MHHATAHQQIRSSLGLTVFTPFKFLKIGGNLEALVGGDRGRRCNKPSDVIASKRSRRRKTETNVDLLSRLK